MSGRSRKHCDYLCNGHILLLVFCRQVLFTSCTYKPLMFYMQVTHNLHASVLIIISPSLAGIIIDNIPSPSPLSSPNFLHA